MDWLKLFVLLVAVASVTIKADGPKKKIRIHLPQKVKHIHHHKKIYITNHPAAPQYAPAYLPSAEGSVSVPNIAMPAMANVVPLNSVELYDETQGRLPGVSAAAAQLLPLYHARGYYGPTQPEIEDQDYDLVSPPDSEDTYVPSAFSSPVASHPSSRPKRVKIIKLNESPRKKVIRKGKPKRVPVRNKPQGPAPIEGELPVSTFHEQFYSDVEGTGTIKKIRKPPRVEKIIDGDTEHIHTYSEEHIHKVFYDEAGHKVAGVVGVDPLTGMSTIAGAQQVIPLKNGHALLAVPAHPFAGLSAVGPVGSPSQFEYAAYNPREVTHDHIFHDHGEIPADIEINRETISLPPKASYTNQGVRVSGSASRPKSKQSQRSKKPTNQTPPDLSYYEAIYSSSNKPKKNPRTKAPASSYENLDDIELTNFRPVPDFGYREKNPKQRNPVTTYYGKNSNDYRVQQSNPPAPFSVSSTIVHDYKPNSYKGTASTGAALTKYKDAYGNFKDSYPSNFDYDAYASSSNQYTSEDKNDVGLETQSNRGKKQSISTQNINFGGQDHLSFIDHLQKNNDEGSIDSAEPSALDNIDQIDDQRQLSNLSILKPSSPLHQYYSAMAAKAFHDTLAAAESSNDNFEYVEAPMSSTSPFPPSVATTSNSATQFIAKTAETTSETHPFVVEMKENRPKQMNKNLKMNTMFERYAIKDSQNILNDFSLKSIRNTENEHPHDQDSNTVRGKLKYGDKI